ncbi:MAG: LemA family protein, partial [Myxococcales bacterium]|nr:LemA family protein [Myxococcales bacterium]
MTGSDPRTRAACGPVAQAASSSGLARPRRSGRPGRLLVAASLLALVASGCGYNDIQAGDEAVKAAWAEISNQYQRRADLIPNLVATVQGAADFERETLQAVVEARSKATSIEITPELVNDPEALQKFMDAQGQLTSALSRLFAVAESYPQLRATDAFRDLQAQIEGTENRITVARGRYIESVQAYNTLVRQFPVVLTAKVIG